MSKGKLKQKQRKADEKMRVARRPRRYRMPDHEPDPIGIALQIAAIAGMRRKHP